MSIYLARHQIFIQGFTWDVNIMTQVWGEEEASLEMGFVTVEGQGDGEAERC